MHLKFYPTLSYLRRDRGLGLYILGFDEREKGEKKEKREKNGIEIQVWRKKGEEMAKGEKNGVDLGFEVLF